MTQEIDRYLDNAEDMLALSRKEGLNANAVDIMHNYLDRITIAGGRGLGIDESISEGVVLVTLVIDESSSMWGVDSIVKQCYKDLTAALSKLSEGRDIQLSTWVFSDIRKLLNSFRPISRAPSTFNQYKPSGGTALYDTVLSALTSQVLYSQELWTSSAQTRNIVIVISDGGDNMSKRDTMGYATKELAQTLSEQGDYILAYVGLGNGTALPIEECRKLAATIGFTEVLSISKTQQDMVDLFSKIAFAVKHVSQSTGLVRSGDFFGFE